ncbi:MAG TPA: hypothetical protein DD379_01035 [Cyanobacteria bacterium UBA11162]|nr:hypothetical protein [Cyanobacteria bacterium UBA11162]
MPILFHIQCLGQYYLAYLQKCQLPLVAGVGVDFLVAVSRDPKQPNKNVPHLAKRGNWRFWCFVQALRK